MGGDTGQFWSALDAADQVAADAHWNALLARPSGFDLSTMNLTSPRMARTTSRPRLGASKMQVWTVASATGCISPH